MTNVKHGGNCNGRILLRLNFCSHGLYLHPKIARFLRFVETSLEVILNSPLDRNNYIACTARSSSLHFVGTYLLGAFAQAIASLTVKSFRMCLDDDFLIDKRSLISIESRQALHKKFIG